MTSRNNRGAVLLPGLSTLQKDIVSRGMHSRFQPSKIYGIVVVYIKTSKLVFHSPRHGIYAAIGVIYRTAASFQSRNSPLLLRHLSISTAAVLPNTRNDHRSHAIYPQSPLTAKRSNTTSAIAARHYHFTVPTHGLAVLSLHYARQHRTTLRNRRNTPVQLLLHIFKAKSTTGHEHR